MSQDFFPSTITQQQLLDELPVVLGKLDEQSRRSVITEVNGQMGSSTREEIFDQSWAPGMRRSIAQAALVSLDALRAAQPDFTDRREIEVTMFAVNQWSRRHKSFSQKG